MLRLLLIVLVSAGWASWACSEPPDPTTPRAPVNDLQKVIADGLARAVLAEKATPGTHAFAAPETLNLLREAPAGRTLLYPLTGRDLPHNENMRFRLLSVEQLAESACAHGGVECLQVRLLRTSGNEAVIEVEVHNVKCPRISPGRPVHSDDLLRGCRAHLLRYEKKDDEWKLISKNLLHITSM